MAPATMIGPKATLAPDGAAAFKPPWTGHAEGCSLSGACQAIKAGRPVRAATTCVGSQRGWRRPYLRTIAPTARG
jgi:hypothetical protein